MTPGHPVEQLFEPEQFAHTDFGRKTADFRHKAALLGLDKPAFYLSIRSRALPDTIYKIFPPDYQEQVIALTEQSGRADLSIDWLNACRSAALVLDTAVSATAPPIEFYQNLSSITLASDMQWIDTMMQQTGALAQQHPFTAQQFTQLNQSWQMLATTPSRGNIWAQFPKVIWNGSQNQYHQWLTQLLKGDFGKSYKNRLPVSALLSMRLKRTMIIGTMSILLALLIGIPLGVIAARSKKTLERSTSIKIALFLYSIPVFWLGSLLILMFATPFAGMHLFRFGCGNATETSIFLWLAQAGPCLILPILCLGVHLGIGFFIQMRSSMAEVLQMEYIRTARAKGLTEGQVFWRHAFPNALFPLVTSLGGVFAFIVAGSVVIEYLFDIPGLGTALHEAFFTRDYPVLFAILLLYSIAIVLGNLLSDLLYAWIDPRVRL
jgi:peptide/nickel transport system permease protein